MDEPQHATGGTAVPLAPEEIPMPAWRVMSEILGKRIVAVTIKRFSDGESHLRPGSLLLLMFHDGTVAVFDNTDEGINTTGGLNSGGWTDAMAYLKGSTRLVHQYKLEMEAGKPQAYGDSVDYV